jgi:hypothetical protein
MRTQKLIQPSDLLDLGDYERARDDIRKRAIAARTVRRVAVGPNATVNFENRQTVLYQIQEILRAERIAKPEGVAEEVESYGELLADAGELAATLMFEFPDRDERDQKLHELVGIDQHVAIEVDGAGTARARFDPRQFDARQVSAVQFIHFPLAPEIRGALATGAQAYVVFDHPAYTYRTSLSAETAAALLGDLAEAA